jgi:putative NIF3 family GTP cyclohydrolase 1 type 2
VERVAAAVRKAHSYEEPAFDVYPLKPDRGATGEGRLGRLPRPQPLGEFAQAVKVAVKAAAVQVVGDPAAAVEKVAVVCGAGGEYFGDALRARVDVFLTGEMRFHDYLNALAQGVALCLPGHYATERFGVEELAVRLQEEYPKLQVWASRRERDPVLTV